jgi:hypothetical protein
VVADTPEEFGAYIRAESTRWSRIIKQQGITTE